MPTDRILVVDDEPPVRRTLSRILGAVGYQCSPAGSVSEARERLNTSNFEMVICDLRMPGESGMELVEQIERDGLQIAVLMATGEDDPEIARAAGKHGVDGYLVKPFSGNELLINVDYALEQARKRFERTRKSDHSLQEAHERASDVRAALIDVAEREQLIDTQRTQMLSRLSEVVGQRDLETGAHIRRIGRHAALLARASGLPEEEARNVGLAAPMHDVGKVAIPDAILLKPGPLTPGEREVMQRHTQIGHDILANSGSPLLDLAASIALTHHERVDGTGYPEGLRGEEIPIAGRIVAIVDVFDALTSERPYRAAMNDEEALAIMHERRGTHFDAELLDCFFDNLDAIERSGAETSASSWPGGRNS